MLTATQYAQLRQALQRLFDRLADDDTCETITLGPIDIDTATVDLDGYEIETPAHARYTIYGHLTRTYQRSTDPEAGPWQELTAEDVYLDNIEPADDENGDPQPTPHEITLLSHQLTIPQR